MILSDDFELELELEHNDEIEEVEEMDNSEEEMLDESGEPVVNVRKFGRVAGYKPRTAIFQIGEKCRVRFIEGNPNFFFELKVNKAESEQENSEDTYRHEAYCTDMLSVMKTALQVNEKSKILNKNEVLGIKDMIEILKETHLEARQHAKDIIKSIKDNSCVDAITNEAISRRVID